MLPLTVLALTGAALVGAYAARTALAARPLLESVHTAADAVRLVRSTRAESTDALVDALRARLDADGVTEADMRRIAALLKSVPDALGEQAFALTVLYSAMLDHAQHAALHASASLG